MATVSIENKEVVLPEFVESAAKTVWRLAWPAVALNSLQVVNNLLDRGFIGHLQDSALTAHGASMNVLFLMFSLAMALATGATAIVSRAYGADLNHEVKHASREAVSLSLLMGIAIALITGFSARACACAILPKTDVAAQVQMQAFVTAYAFGLPAIFIIQTIAGSLRGIGDTLSPMIISGVQILLHISLNFILIFPVRHFGGITIPGANMGLAGAATALSISATISAFAYLIYTSRTPLGRLWKFRVPSFQWAERILRIALPAAAMASLRVFSLTAFTVVLTMVPEGSAAIAGMSVAFALESVMFMPSFGLSVAVAALVGQSLGMQKPERASKLGWAAAHHGALVTLVIAGPIFIEAPAIANLILDQKPLIAEQATHLLRALCATEILFSYAMILLGAMQGAGDTVRPMWITLFCLWGLRVPLTIIFALHSGALLFGLIPVPIGIGLGSTGAWIAMSSTQGLQGVLALAFFRQGAWKRARV